MSVRFAPSPTGRFHVGNLRTAWISHWWSQTLNKQWVVRFEDIDGPRVVLGALEGQLADMAALGLVPDRVEVQSTRRLRHWEVFRAFLQAGLVYPCFCSRKTVLQVIERSSSAPHGIEALYSGACRSTGSAPKADLPTIAWRLKMPDPSGRHDFIVARTKSREPAGDGADFIPAYHWACALDDYDGRHDLLVRAWDLESALYLQRSIQGMLKNLENAEFSYPSVFYCSLIVQNDGRRLEKRTKGVSLEELEHQGISPEDLIQRFKRSFKQWQEVHSIKDDIAGESLKVLPLKDLGL